MGDEYNDPVVAGNSRPSASFGIDIVTLFPAMFAGPFDISMIGRAQDSGLIDVRIHDLRQWATDKHRTTDDYAFGGGGGMVLKPEPLFAAVEAILGIGPISSQAPARSPCPIVLTTPQGRTLDHALARELAGAERLVVLCGHYEGFDERVRQHLATHELSIGDYVLTGGELPAMVLVDAVARLRPGVLGLATGADTDSFAQGLLEAPHYTRPADFRGWGVPPVLLSGDHGAVAGWRRQQAVARTARRRPDLLAAVSLTPAEIAGLASTSMDAAQNRVAEGDLADDGW